MTPAPHLDFFSIVVALIGSMIGQELAPYIGAYGIILFGWFTGLLVGRYRMPADSKISTTAFVVVTLSITLGSTVFAAGVISRQFGLEMTALLWPVAFVIPAVGHSWFALIARGLKKIRGDGDK